MSDTLSGLSDVCQRAKIWLNHGTKSPTGGVQSVRLINEISRIGLPTEWVK